MLQRLGRDEITERIAAGDQGTVYRARDTVLDRIVAIKVINQLVSDPQVLADIRNEARLTANLDHSNIVRVYDFEVDNSMAVGCANSLTSCCIIRSRRIHKCLCHQSSGGFLADVDERGSTTSTRLENHRSAQSVERLVGRNFQPTEWRIRPCFCTRNVDCKRHPTRGGDLAQPSL